MTDTIIGRLTRSEMIGFSFRCQRGQQNLPQYGSLVRARVEPRYQVYGLVYNIHWIDDGIVKQLASSENLPNTIVSDNRLTRNAGPEVDVLVIGFKDGVIHHALPLCPPCSLEEIVRCQTEELVAFTTGRLGYFRHIIKAKEMLSAGDLMAAHLKQANDAQMAYGNSHWMRTALTQITSLLRDDYETLVDIYDAVSTNFPNLVLA